MSFGILNARRWARAWKRKASGEGKGSFVRLLVKRDRKQKARIAELERALRPFAKENMDHWHMEQCNTCETRSHSRKVLDNE